MADSGCSAWQHSHELCEEGAARQGETSLEATVIIQRRHEGLNLDISCTDREEGMECK